MTLSDMRGFSIFINNIWNCQNKEQERLHVDKKLGNIHTHFKNEKVRVFNFSFSMLFLISFVFFFLVISVTILYWFLIAISHFSQVDRIWREDRGLLIEEASLLLTKLPWRYPTWKAYPSSSTTFGIART